jgi:hypothetical protein
MALLTGQVSVRNLVMGEGTPYEVSEFNPYNRHVRAEQSGPRAWNHGGWSGVEWAEEVVVPMRIAIVANNIDDWLAAHQQLMAAFAAVGESPADVELRWELAGREFVMFGRPRMVEPDIKRIVNGHSFTSAAFVALDPLIYAGAETVTAAIGLPTFTGGLTVPFTVPFTVDGIAADGFADITNTGTAETGLFLRIDGPVVTPSVTLVRGDGSFQRLTFDLDLSAGQWLDVDTAARVVLLNGTTSRRGQTSGDWPILPPGGHRVQWSSPNYNNVAELSVTFRSAWH